MIYCDICKRWCHSTHVHVPPSAVDAIDHRPEVRDDAPAVTMTLGDARKPGGILSVLARLAKKGPLA